MDKLRTYENYEKTGSDTPKKGNISNDDMNAKIKEIVDNVLKAKQYFMMLQDTADTVYEMLEKAIPPNAEAFLTALGEKDDILTSLFEDLIGIIEEQQATTEIDEICRTLKNMYEYTEDNMDDILSGDGGEIWSDGFEEEEDDGEDDSKDQFVSPVPPVITKPPVKPVLDVPESQLKRKSGESKYIVCPDCEGSGISEENELEDCATCYGAGKVENPNLKKKVEPIKSKSSNEVHGICPKCKGTGENKNGSECDECDGFGFVPEKVSEELDLKDMEKKLKGYQKKYKIFNDGDIVYITGVKGDGKILNGTKCKIIRKSKEKENCYDLLNPQRKPEESGSNMNGVPVEYLTKEKPVK